MEELLKPGERELKEAVTYIQSLIDDINDLIANYENVLASRGILPRLLPLVSLITLHRYYPDLVFKEVWPSFRPLVDQMAQIPELKDAMGSVLEDVKVLDNIKASLKM